MRGLAAAPVVVLGLALMMPGCQSADQPAMPTHFSADQVVLNVPGMVWPTSWTARVRKALEGLQSVDKSKPIYVDIKTKRAAFTVSDRRQFNGDEVLQALKKAGFPDATVIKKPG